MFASVLGFEVVALGKGKNNPLDVSATPDSVADEARKKGVNPKMLASFQDGTKTMVEMTAVSNATGFLPDVPGMHGPKASLELLPRLYSLREEGGILHRKGVVDYVDGVAPGVFAVITTDHPAVHDQMKYLKMGKVPITSSTGPSSDQSGDADLHRPGVFRPGADHRSLLRFGF